MRRLTDKMHLECQLTNEELLAYSKQLAEETAYRNKTENELQYTKEDFKKRLEKHEATINVLLQKISTEKETRFVDIRIEYDWSAGKKSFYRLDTGDIFKDEPITPEELQEKMEFEKAEKPEEVAA